MLALLLTLLLPLHAAIVGTSKPAESLNAERVAAVLPPARRAPWLDYLRHSNAQLHFDQDEPFIERGHLTGPVPPLPKESSGARSMPLNRDPEFYRSATALHIAETILSFQIPNGGWSKNLDMSGPARLVGQSYTPNNISRFLGPDDFDAPHDPAWTYAGTLDNDATITELRFLARISTAHPGPDGDRFRKAFIRGVYYLLNAQYPNGGWPQVWPLEGGYHDAITYNDNAVTQAATLLHEISTGATDNAFVPEGLRVLAGKASDRAIECILETQVRIDGKLTMWAQQHDPLTLAPVAGRNFEPAALSAGESSEILIFLMQIEEPSPAVYAAIEAGISWLRAHAIYGQAFVGGGRRPPAAGQPASPPPDPRHLAPAPGAGPIWARFYSIQTGQPIFGDRDKTIHDDVAELSTERRNGYAWYSPSAKEALDFYTDWKPDHLGPANQPSTPAAAVSRQDQ